MTIPEIIVVGNVEFLFAGAAFALGFPRMARRILKNRYPGVSEDDEKAPTDDGE